VAIQHSLFADRRGIAQVIDGAHREAPITRLIIDSVAGGRTGTFDTGSGRLSWLVASSENGSSGFS
jgi:hypothetical protein